MRFATIVASICLCVALTATGSQASTIWNSGSPLDFDYHTESGGTTPIIGSPYYEYDTPAAGLMTQNSNGVNGWGGYGLNSGVRSAEMVSANGWFAEWRMKTLDVTGANQASKNDQVSVQLGDDVSAIILTMLPDSFKHTSGGVTYVDGPAYTQDEFHTFRVTKPAGSTDYKLSVDGGAPVDVAGTTSPGYQNFLFFGDANSLAGGGIVEWDYVAVNTTPVVPEPASIVLLLCSGLVGLALSRKR